MTNQNWQQDMWHGSQQPPQSQSQQQQQQQQPQQEQTPYAATYGAPTYTAAPGAAAQAAVPTEQPKRRGWIVALVAVILFFVLMFAGLASCTSVMSSSIDSVSMFDSSGGSSADYLTDDTVAIIEIAGTIQYDGTVCSPEGLKEQLDIAENNEHIKAVVLRIDSGGGTATAGEEMSIYVSEFSKPIVVSSASINASAAYEISSQADYIFTAKTTAIGSIGTVLQITDLSGLYEKLGISVENITSSESKDSSYGDRALTDEERAWYQHQVDQINETFIENVAAGRGMSIDEVRALANGMTYTGMDAVENGLADEIGTLEDAIDKACELAGIDYCDTIYLYNEYYDIYSMFGFESEEDFSKLAALLKEHDNNVGFEG